MGGRPWPAAPPAGGAALGPRALPPALAAASSRSLCCTVPQMYRLSDVKRMARQRHGTWEDFQIKQRSFQARSRCVLLSVPACWPARALLLPVTARR